MAWEDDPDPGDPRLESGAAWLAFCDALRDSAARVIGPGVPATPRDRAEGFRYLTRFLAAGLAVCLEHADPDEPEFGRMIEHTRKWGLDMPDCLYLYASVRGDAAYRIHGLRGSAHHLDVQVNAGHFAEGDLGSLQTLDSLHGLELQVGADGALELWLGGEPRPHNWLRLEDDAEFVLVRQYFGDWDREVPADLWIERVGGGAPAPPPRSDQIADRLERLTRWLERGGALWQRMSDGLLDLAPNSLVIHDPNAAAQRTGLRGQVYGLGNFRCGPEEAVIVEFAPPPCHHWSVSLANSYWESLDYATHQSSLNGQQARLDADGRFRGVIAERDPGVANWLDPCGQPRGSLAVRFLLAEQVPEIRVTCLPLDDLGSTLPADTPQVDREMRGESLLRRRRAVWRRHRR